MKILKHILSASLVIGLLGCSTGNIFQQDTSLTEALAGDHRSVKNKARDAYRNPSETLTFFDFKPNMTVVELAPGGGWYMEVLAPALKAKGKYYGAHYPDTGKDDYFSKTRRKLEAKIVSNNVYSNVELTDFLPRQPSIIAPVASADLVLTFRNLHNWKEEEILQMYKDAFVALKSGGIMGVVEHRMPSSLVWEDNQHSGYFPQALAIKLAEQAGFKLAATSEINANPKDTAQHPKGVWTLPPVLRLGEDNKAKYLVIGESDRMTLKFIKP